ncbi:MAG: MarR family transcriptional regulator [Deltaproteobacteria bacterium]|nr:MarR family transcriptional regulator [Deltaproteobacteria bacterium]
MQIDQIKIKASAANFNGRSFFTALIELSVDLHNLNARVQRVCGVSLVQWMVLNRILDQPGISAGSLAETTGVHPSTLTPTITRLEAAGYIYIQDRPTDLRRRMLLGSRDGVLKNNRCIAYLESIIGSICEADRLENEARGLASVAKHLIKNMV